MTGSELVCESQAWEETCEAEREKFNLRQQKKFRKKFEPIIDEMLQSLADKVGVNISIVVGNGTCLATAYDPIEGITYTAHRPLIIESGGPKIDIDWDNDEDIPEWFFEDQDKEDEFHRQVDEKFTSLAAVYAIMCDASYEDCMDIWDMEYKSKNL